MGGRDERLGCRNEMKEEEEEWAGEGGQETMENSWEKWEGWRETGWPLGSLISHINYGRGVCVCVTQFSYVCGVRSPGVYYACVVWRALLRQTAGWRLGFSVRTLVVMFQVNLHRPIQDILIQSIMCFYSFPSVTCLSFILQNYVWHYKTVFLFSWRGKSNKALWSLTTAEWWHATCKKHFMTLSQKQPWSKALWLPYM